MKMKTNKEHTEERMKRTNILQLGVLILLGAVALFGLFGCDIEEIIEGSVGGNVEAIREVTETYEITGLLDLFIASEGSSE